MTREDSEILGEQGPKLIIDEDWKTQVQREKEQWKQRKESVGQSGQTDRGSPEASGPPNPTGAASPRVQPLPEKAPPATFEHLVSGIATQALAAMGQLSDEEGKPFPAHLDYARHYIDLLAVLEDKTKGNLTEREQHFLQEALHQLRMLFVTIKKS